MNKKSSSATTIELSPFNLTPNDSKQKKTSKTSSETSMLRVAPDLLDLVGRTQDKIRMKIPVAVNQTLSALLIRQPITAPGFQVNTSSGKKTDAKEILNNQFAGVIENMPGSVSAFSITKQGVFGFTGGSEGPRFFQNSPEADGQTLFTYRATDTLIAGENFCSADVRPLEQNLQVLIGNPAIRVMENCKMIRMRVEVTYNMYKYNGYDIEKSIAYVAGLFNLTAAVLKKEGIDIRLSEIFIWDQPDIYQGTTDIYSYFSRYDKFIGNKNYDVPTDLVHIITPVHVGNSAARGNILDTNFSRKPVAVSTALESYQMWPVSSQATYNFMHETGHLLGSPHTHSCSWPGGPIDNCAPQEGFCPPGPAPVNGGTLMSYCTKTVQMQKLFRYEYGELPGALMRACIQKSRYGISCASSSCADEYAEDVRIEEKADNLLIRWKAKASRYRIGVKSSRNYQWKFDDVSNVDSFLFKKDRCETTIEYSIAPYCDQTGEPGLNQLFHYGDINLARLTMGGKTANLCFGDSTVVFVQNRPPGYRYTWYANGIAQPVSEDAFFRAKDTGFYYVSAERGGCVYNSDSTYVRYATINSSFSIVMKKNRVEFRPATVCKTKYEWHFGDGKSDTARFPVHVYEQGGIYSARLKRTDSLGRSSTTQVTINLKDVLIDSLDSGSPAFNSRLRFGDTLCRTAAVFTTDSASYPYSWPRLNYGISSPAGDYYKPLASGTLEFKIFPGKPFQNQGTANVRVSDTGSIVHFSDGLGHGVQLWYTTWGGIAWKVNESMVGNISREYAGPLKFNQWNTVGVSFGKKGIRLMVNGALTGSLQEPVTDSFFQQMNLEVGGYISKMESYSLTYIGFTGLIDLVRRSHTENDFTFSGHIPSQGRDSTLLVMQVCEGSSFKGHSKTGTYYLKESGTDGCEQITELGLTVAESLKISEQIQHAVGGGKGRLSINVSGGVRPYNISWSDGISDSLNRRVKPGEYHVVVTDSLLCRLEKTYIVSELDGAQLTAKVQPNPVQSGSGTLLRLGIPENSTVSIKISDNQGRSVFQISQLFTAGVHNYQLNTSMPAGIYFVHISNGKQKAATARLIVY